MVARTRPTSLAVVFTRDGREADRRLSAGGDRAFRAALTILAGVGEALYDHDMRMVLCPTYHEHDREVTLLERLMQGTTDGALLVLPEESGEDLAALREHDYPFVVVDPHTSPGEHVPTVSAANSSGASEAVEYLLALGHRRIAAVTGPRGWIATEERLRGYHGALASAGVLPSAELEVEGDFLVGGGQRALAQLLDLHEPPTAIFAFNDMLAIGIMQAASERGLRIPGDLSILGFDDTFEASIVTPALTTVRQPLAEMGRIGVTLLARQLANQQTEALQIELKTQLIVRDSTAVATTRPHKQGRANSASGPLTASARNRPIGHRQQPDPAR